jgi:hypothetical protein
MTRLQIIARPLRRPLNNAHALALTRTLSLQTQHRCKETRKEKKKQTMQATTPRKRALRMPQAFLNCLEHTQLLETSTSETALTQISFH